MDDKMINVFVSKEYHLLYWMKQHQMETLSGPIIKFSQIELAKEYGSSPATINKWLQALQSADCVIQKKKGCYQITERGYVVIDKINELDQIVKGGIPCKPQD